VNQEDYQRRQRERAKVMGWLLIGFAVLVFGISIAKMQITG
jgi:hypothetical protein